MAQPSFAPVTPGGFLWRHAPHAVFFFSCAAIMVVELVASRLIASHLGSSLYTWTAVIAVMLAGISGGNVIGGRLSDRHPPDALLGWLFLAAATACLIALALNAGFAAARPLVGLPWPLRILLSVLAIFALPAVGLGTLSPSLARIAVLRAPQAGAALGSFYACGTIGSIAGTFATGFYLLFALGNARVVLITALLLAALGGVSRLLLRIGGLSLETGDPMGATTYRARVEMPGIAGPLAWRYAPHAVAFLAALCLMAVEIIAGRAIAEQAGSSLYTWTSVIGVVFGGMSVGSYAGGRLSDHIPPTQLIGWLFLAASVTVVAVPAVTFALAANEAFGRWHWPALVFATVFCIFVSPSVLLGSFIPVSTRLAVQQSTAPGAAIGSVSAWNAVGSIVGTVSTGFVLIPALGLRSLTMLVAVALAFAGLVLGPRRQLHVAWTLLAIAALLLARGGLPWAAHWKYAAVFHDTGEYNFSADSAYQQVRVYEDTSEDDPDRTLRVVSLDYLIHGYVDMNDPTFLNYGYERIYRDVVRRIVANRTTVSAFFLGGGSYTFPRWLRAQWPGSTAVVAEIDPTVLEANYRATGLPRNTPIRTIVMDARNAVDDLPAGTRFDFFFGDAFNDLAVPYHLTTVEFARKVASHLNPGGAYLVNVIDSYENGLLLGAFVVTLQQVFKHVYVFCTEQDGVGTERDTFVLTATNTPIDTTGWEPRHGTGFEGSLLTRRNIEELTRKCGGRVLTDDNAPVENLIAPVVRGRTRTEEK